MAIYRAGISKYRGLPTIPAFAMHSASTIVSPVEDALHVNRILRKFFVRYTDFRVMMRETESVISGSQPLQLFLNTEYAGSDLDIYVHGSSAYTVWCRLVDEEHYQPDSPASPGRQTYATIAGVAKVSTFRKGRAKVQMVEVEFCPVATILRFHSSCVMNLSSADAFVSFFPTATRAMINYMFTQPTPITREDRRQLQAISEKYAERGFNNRMSVKSNDIMLPLGARSFGDSHCFVAKYHDNVSALTSNTADVVDISSEGNRWLTQRLGIKPINVFDHVVKLSTPVRLFIRVPCESEEVEPAEFYLDPNRLAGLLTQVADDI